MCSPVLPTNVRLGRKRLLLANTVAYLAKVLMEQHIFMQFNNKLTEGSSEKIDRTITYNKINATTKLFYCYYTSALFKSTHLLVKTIC